MMQCNKRPVKQVLKFGSGLNYAQSPKSARQLISNVNMDYQSALKDLRKDAK
jgi:hypothetical protein